MSADENKNKARTKHPGERSLFKKSPPYFDSSLPDDVVMLDEDAAKNATNGNAED
ncbi:hypothetical protein [Bacillus fonticola]|uniref:hypothetical protein n=1 Tax=Bacillus fonticola TaxID=2728853 RepID=UPI001473CAEC|nr:hypothetical protein [Bacillus fonticola]